MKKISKLNQELKNLQLEITEYQKNCKHNNTQLKALINNDVKIVCVRCDKSLRWPSAFELNNWLKK